MLGLRRFKNCQVDLWCGDINKFAVDAIVESPSKIAPHLGAEPGLFRHALHVAIPVSQDDKFSCQAVRQFLEEREANHSLRRITFVLGELATYHEFQETFFQVFPEQQDV